MQGVCWYRGLRKVVIRGISVLVSPGAGEIECWSGNLGSGVLKQTMFFTTQIVGTAYFLAEWGTGYFMADYRLVYPGDAKG